MSKIRNFKVTGAEVKDIAGRLIHAVFDLSSKLEEEEGLLTGVRQHQNKIRKVISKSLSDYPESQIELVLKCLLAEGELDTEEEARSYMGDEHS